MIALLGNIARDVFPDRPPRTGGGPYHAARALRELGVEAQIWARCAAEDSDSLVPDVAAFGTPVHYVPGRSTASFWIAYDDRHRLMRVEAAGDAWLPDDLPPLPDAVRWVHVAPLLRSDFPAATLARIGEGRRLSLDGQGLVRAPVLGELQLDADYDPALLEHVDVLKLSEEEAAVLGDPASLPVREVLVTRGSLGSTLYVDGRPEEVPAEGIDSEPTGCGDAFSITYVAARAEGASPLAAAQRATAVVAAMLTAAKA